MNQKRQWDREVDRKSAEWNLLTAVMAFKRAGYDLQEVQDMAADMWTDHVRIMSELIERRA